MTNKIYTSIGLMSGTSLDGVDAALIETDGRRYIKPLGFLTIPYDEKTRDLTRACFGRNDLDAPDIEHASNELTEFHVRAVQDLLRQMEYKAEDIDLLGFHGQTILHNAGQKISIQIGNAQMLSSKTGIDTVYDFRNADIQAGGQGAPLAPLYHRARTETDHLENPVAIINIGGVGNITYISSTRHSGESRDLANTEDNGNPVPTSAGLTEILLAFDTGPGNALMDDFCKARTGKPYDEDGKLAAQGMADQKILEKWMAHPYFAKTPPKSLDRNEWDIADLGPLARDLEDLSTEDALATLMAFTVRGIANSFDHLPQAPKAAYICGGGRRNETLMVALDFALDCPVAPVETLHWDGDATEAECFAYLAVRSLLQLPISFPTTTGVPKPMSGGKLVKAQ